MDIKKTINYTKEYGLGFLNLKIREKLGTSAPEETRHYVEKFYRNLSPEQREKKLKKQFRDKTGYSLDLENPHTLDEKLQWLKLYDSTPLKTQLSDKIAVRDWVKEKIGEQYLIPLIGIWDSFEEIDFNTLPEEYAIQCNHGSEMIIIVRKGKPLDIENAKLKFHKWLSTNYGLSFRFELQYRDIHPQIIATKYLENISGDLFDYKFYCFNGFVKFINVIKGRYEDERMSFYDTNWNKQEFYYTFGRMRRDDEVCEKPKQLETAIKLAEKLSKGFSFVRVDLYLIEDKIYFGEMTFTPYYGEMTWTPKEADRMLGDLLTLPKKKYVL